MDVAYDQVQGETLKEVEKKEGTATESSPGASEASTQSAIGDEIKGAYDAVSNSPWGARLGGLWGTVKKQSQTYFEQAQKEYNAASTEANRVLMDLGTRARAVSLTNDNIAGSTVIASADGQSFSEDLPRASTDSSMTARPNVDGSGSVTEHAGRPDSLPADIVKEAETLLTRFKGEAAKRLQEVRKAEDAADEALEKFGTNIRNFLRDAVTVTAPTGAGGEGDAGDKVLFESKDADGKRVIHTTRFDAQLHVIHSSVDSFLRDPKSEQYEPWAKEFNVEKRTDEIGRDLDKYEELRRAMEKCVPEKIDYATFWTRYYFLRHVIESEEVRRRELLKGAANTEQEVAWDEDSDSEGNATPSNKANASTTTLTTSSVAAGEGTEAPRPSTQETLKPAESRRSHDLQSQAGSESSYDIVSGASSRAPGSPKDDKTPEGAKVKSVAEESDEEDWE